MDFLFRQGDHTRSGVAAQLVIVSVGAEVTAFALGSIADAASTSSTALAATTSTPSWGCSSMSTGSSTSWLLRLRRHFPELILVVHGDAMFGGQPVPQFIRGVKIPGFAGTQPLGEQGIDRVDIHVSVVVMVAPHIIVTVSIAVRI